MKKIVIIVLLAAAIAGAVFWGRYSNKVYYNAEGTSGNSAGNLYNGGLFCEIDGIIYFANHKDDGALYSMDTDLSNVEKILTDKVVSINADSHYVYYSRRNYEKENRVVSALNFQDHGIFRMTRKDKKLTMLTEELNGILCLSGNNIFFQQLDRSGNIEIHRVSIDKKDTKLLTKEPLIPASVRNGLLYYAGVSSDHYLHTMALSSGAEELVSDQFCYMPVAMPAYIYYIATTDGHHLCRMDYSGGSKETLVEDFCSTFNITPDERYLYYQIDGGDDNRIVQLDLVTGFTTTLIDGNYKQIHVTSKYIFFYDFNGKTVYAYDRATELLSVFNPPVIEE